MARPTIVEQNFFEFKIALQRATDGGFRIEETDKDRWKHWVRENKVQEAAFHKIAGNKFDEIRAVIIDEDGPWGGYFIYAPMEEACLKWTPG